MKKILFHIKYMKTKIINNFIKHNFIKLNIEIKKNNYKNNSSTKLDFYIS
jgi:hypothetical protein